MVHKPSSRLLISFLLQSIKRRAFENSAAKVGQQNLSNCDLEFHSPGPPLIWKSVFKRTKLQRVGRFLNIFFGCPALGCTIRPRWVIGANVNLTRPPLKRPSGVKVKARRPVCSHHGQNENLSSSHSGSASNHITGVGGWGNYCDSAHIPSTIPSSPPPPRPSQEQLGSEYTRRSQTDAQALSKAFHRAVPSRAYASTTKYCWGISRLYCGR